MDRIALIALALLGAGTLLHPVLTAGGTAAASPTALTAATTSFPSITFDQYKGATGYWRLGRSAEGVWWFVSPTGSAEFLNSVTTVQPYQEGRDAAKPHFRSSDFAGDTRAWGEKTLARVKAAGFKSLGAWSNPIFHELDVPMTRDLNVWSWVAGPCRRLYSTTWYETAEKAIRTQTTPLKDNKNLVGYFIDNELDWGDTASGPAAYFDYLDLGDPNRAAVVRSVKNVWPTIADYNVAFGTKLASFEELAALPTLPHSNVVSYDRLYRAFLTQLATDYFKQTCELIRKYDPNHLVLGVRFRGYAPPEVVRGSRGLTDAQSINYYVSDARLDADMFRMMHEDSGGQPVLITEYSFHALDGRSGNQNVVGFAGQVIDQQARADGYRLFTKRLAEVPFLVGADWFQWSDEPGSGRVSDGEDVNFGVVDTNDSPYDALVAAVRETTPTLNGLHANSIATAAAQGATVWRENFAAKPTFHVPYLATPVTLDGDLADWSAASRLPNIRVSDTVGSERLNLPKPNVFIGWRDEGLYIAMEVFDNDIDTMRADGWWWTRDCTEFWLSTRPVPVDQVFYDKFCQQYFMVPNANVPAEKPQATVGQWHRDGDALSSSIVPQPLIKQSAKVVDGKYVIEMFIPAAAMVGYEPRTQPTLAFNVHAHNWQQATDYFWSAPKEVWTQTRPNTWGTLKLEAPEVAAAR